MHRVDSRKVLEGDCFYALRGERTDGHLFLQEAARRGAACAVVEEGYAGPDYGLELLRVPDPLAELQGRARKKLADSGARVAAVTGSVGKTTTKEFLKSLLSEQFSVCCSPGNHNTQIGLPLTILNEMEGGEEMLVLEMGMTHPGQIARLVGIAPPEVAIVTEVTYVHACNFENLEQIARAKSEIFSHSGTRVAVFPKRLGLDAGNCRVFHSEEAEGIIEGIELPVPGMHNRQNLMSAAAAALALGLDREEIRRGAQKIALPAGRFQTMNKNGLTLVCDAYNSCALSVKAALENLPSGKRRIAVLGEMRELGKFSDGLHREVGEYAQQFVDIMLCLGPACRPIVESWEAAGLPAALCLTRDELLAQLKELAKPGDVVLIKGSRSLEMEKIAEQL